MSEQQIDLLHDDDDVEFQPVVIYSPRILNKINIAITTQHFGLKRYSIDFNRYLSSIFQTHPDKYRYIHVKDVPIKQRLDEETTLRGKVSLYLEYNENGFVVITAMLTDHSFESTDTFTFVSFDNICDVVVESLEVDGLHTLVTGHKPRAEQPAASLKQLTRITLQGALLDNETRAYNFQLPTGAGSFTLINKDHAKVVMDNVRLFTIDEVNNRKIEIGVSLEATSIDQQLLVTGVRVIAPVVYRKDLNHEWVKRQTDKAEFFGWVSEVEADDAVTVSLDMPEDYMLHPYVYREGMNHHPAYPGIWVPYNNWRLKDRYDIQLKNGERWSYYYPNGNSFAKWTEHDGPDRVEDDEVAMVRLIPDEEITEKYHFKGKDRLERNVKMFGNALPQVEELADGTINFRITYRRHFRDEQISSHEVPDDVFNSGPTHYLMAHEYTLTEIMHMPFKVGEPLYKAAVHYLKNVVKGKVFRGMALIQDKKEGYIGSIDDSNFADPEIDWVIRQLINVAKELPERPKVKNVGSIGHVSQHNVGELAEILSRPRGKNEGKHNLNGRVYPADKPKRLTKADKKAAKKAKVKLMKAQREQQ
jgi:hypothetical protein